MCARVRARRYRLYSLYKALKVSLLVISLPENPSEPFGASVIIDGVTYGTGTASSKKLAKNKAGTSVYYYYLLFIYLFLPALLPCETRLSVNSKASVYFPCMKIFRGFFLMGANLQAPRGTISIQGKL